MDTLTSLQRLAESVSRKIAGLRPKRYCKKPRLCARSGEMHCKRIPPYNKKYASEPSCDCDDCVGLTPLVIPWWILSRNAYKRRATLIGLFGFFFIVRFVSQMYPYGVTTQPSLGYDVDSTMSRVIFTLKQHVWSTIPFLFAKLMHYIPALIITAAIYSVLSKRASHPTTESFFNDSCKIINRIITVLVLSLAFDSKVFIQYIPTCIK